MAIIMASNRCIYCCAVLLSAIVAGGTVAGILLTRDNKIDDTIYPLCKGANTTRLACDMQSQEQGIAVCQYDDDSGASETLCLSEDAARAHLESYTDNTCGKCAPSPATPTPSPPIPSTPTPPTFPTSTNMPSLAPSTNMPSTPRTADIESILAGLAPLHPEAFNWITNVDTWAPPETATNINALWIERYSLAVFYYSTDGDSWTSNQNWLSAASVCEWEDIWCQNSQFVSDMEIAANSFTGSLPTEIGVLTSLTNLYLDSNSFTGSLPTEIGALTNLGDLYLAFNSFTGSVPTAMGALTNLHYLYLYSNSFTGSLPTEVGALTNLDTLYIAGNSFTGSLPTEIGALTNLVTLYLAGNSLTGSLPTEVGALTNLAYLVLSANSFTGSLPTEISAMANLEELALAANSFTGSLPTEKGALANLYSLDLGNNDFTGHLPAEITNRFAEYRLCKLDGNCFPNIDIVDAICNTTNNCR